jgi:hypothetical protein
VNRALDACVERLALAHQRRAEPAVGVGDVRHAFAERARAFGRPESVVGFRHSLGSGRHRRGGTLEETGEDGR